ncbi:MAG: 3-hydroxyacyl-CoA dehydrogenase [Betaproteobacteria bacterium]|nr:3-hydroxyacyl-CoA dehydrogenase [Betaproteobacteria bacterium]
MSYQILRRGESRSFPVPHAFTEGAAGAGAGIFLTGAGAGKAFAELPDTTAFEFIAIELGTECLGVHTGESRGEEGFNVVGFARFRLGDAEPTKLVELVKQPRTFQRALEAAKMALEGSGLVVAVCNDFPGCIVDRLVRPYYNAVLRRLDEKLASADGLDMTLKLGLGYPEGPISLLERTGLAHHHDVTQALYEALGQEAYAPARRAQVSKTRSGRKPNE